MRNIETFPSKQMYPCLSLDERKVAEFCHNIDRKRWLVWVKMSYFHHLFRTIHGVLASLANQSSNAYSGWVFETVGMVFRWNNLAWSDATSADSDGKGAIERPSEGT